jgi:hypothetical protein
MKTHPQLTEPVPIVYTNCRWCNVVYDVTNSASVVCCNGCLSARKAKAKTDQHAKEHARTMYYKQPYCDRAAYNGSASYMSPIQSLAYRQWEDAR